MDSRTRLDYALFQLTPTRTRCDLVMYAGNKSEKIASGLLEPFLSHLKYAKDQISKGGYSISLKPVSSDASWFTKSTLERFVRFVSTPEVLERFVTIEKEIVQIQSSVQSNEQLNGASEAEGLKRSAERDGSNNAGKEENSKVHLQRVLETRKNVLRKEQAMAYARALVAGFEIDYIDDLLAFADAFGALRLREACMNFMELCNKKNEDRIWMDEVAAMQALSQSEYPYSRTSGIILAGENDPNQDTMMNASASDSTTSLGSSDATQDKMNSTEGKAPIPTWANHPQYMQNFQGPVFPHMPPYQGYHFPGMPQFYSGNMPWPSNVENPNLDVGQPRHSKKETSNGNEDYVSSSQSDSDDHDDRGRRHKSAKNSNKNKNGKSSSRKVVIRNINYITSEKRNGETDTSSDYSSGDDEVIDADSLKQQVEAIGKYHKSTYRNSKKRDGSKKYRSKTDNAANKDVENVIATESMEETRNESWDIFQNLLMRDAESKSNDMEEPYATKSSAAEISSAFNVGSEKLSQNRATATDTFLLPETRTSDEGNTNRGTFEIEEGVYPIIKRQGTGEDLYSSKVEQQGNIFQGDFSDRGNESSTIKSRKEEDWFVPNLQDRSGDQGREEQTTLYSDNHLVVEKDKKDLLIDDSFMVQDRSISYQPDAQRGTDIFMVSDVMAAGQANHTIQDDLQGKLDSSKNHEPDDLYVVLERRHSSAEQLGTSWNPEMEYVNENVKRHSDTEQNDSTDKPLQNGDGAKKATGKAAGGKITSKDSKSKSAAASLQKSKSEITSRNRKPPIVSRTISHMSKALKEEDSRKKMEELQKQRQKRIAERSAAKGQTAKSNSREIRASTMSAKLEKPQHKATNEEKKNLHKPVMKSSTIERLSAARTTYKQPPAESKASQTKKGIKKENGPSSLKKSVDLQNKKIGQDNVKSSTKRTENTESNGGPNLTDDQGRKFLDVTNSTSKDLNDEKANQPSDGNAPNIKELLTVSSVEKNEEEIIIQQDGLDIKNSNQEVSNEKYPKGGNEEISEANGTKDMTVTDDSVGISHESSMNPSLMIHTSVIDDENGLDKKNNTVSTEISTPPPTSETSEELSHSRKKWNSSENSPKVTKGIRKLLLFGRKG